MRGSLVEESDKQQQDVATSDKQSDIQQKQQSLSNEQKQEHHQHLPGSSMNPNLYHNRQVGK